MCKSPLQIISSFWSDIKNPIVPTIPFYLNIRLPNYAERKETGIESIYTQLWF